MLDIAKRTVSRTAPIVRNEMAFEAVTFGIHEPTGTPYAELRLTATVPGKPEEGQDNIRLRRYKTAEEFHDDYCADHEAATNAWIDSQIDERAPTEIDEEEDEPAQ